MFRLQLLIKQALKRSYQISISTIPGCVLKYVTCTKIGKHLDCLMEEQVYALAQSLRILNVLCHLRLFDKGEGVVEGSVIWQIHVYRHNQKIGDSRIKYEITFEKKRENLRGGGGCNVAVSNCMQFTGFLLTI